jgi:hypothetical protein
MIAGMLLSVAALGLVGFVVTLAVRFYRAQQTGMTENEQRTDYDEVGPYHEGLTVVVKHLPNNHWGTPQDRYGYIDAKGNRITYVRYSEARPFAEGRAFVRLADIDAATPKGGFIDPTGHEVIPPIYLAADQFRNGLCLVQSEEGTGFIDRDGRAQGPFCYLNFQPLGDNDLFPVSIINPNKTDAFDPTELWGYVDTAGREVIPAQYSAATPFRAGYALVSCIDPTNFQTRQGLIDSTGRVVLPLDYVRVNFPENGDIEAVRPDGNREIIKVF